MRPQSSNDSLDDSGLESEIEFADGKIPKQNPRVLIQILRMFPASLIHEVSSRSNCIRLTAKLPMFFLLVCTGLIGGVTTTTFKLIGQLTVEKKFGEQAGFVCLLLLISLPGNILQLLFLNVSMKYYD